MTDVMTGLAARLEAGEPLDDRNLEALAESRDLLTLGALADQARRRRHADRVTFVRVLELGADQAGAGSGPLAPAAGEVRLAGTPPSIDAAIRVVERLAGRLDGRPLTGFALDALDEVCGHRAGDLEGALGRLRKAGLDLVAEVRLDGSAEGRRALAAAAAAGLGIARASIGAGPAAGALEIVRALRAWGPELAPVRALAPLGSDAARAVSSTGFDDVRLVALARLAVDGIASIQVDWRLYGPKLAQVALTFGADDLDNVPAEETGDLGRRRAVLEEVRRNIRAASFVPVERDGRFEPRDG